MPSHVGYGNESRYLFESIGPSTRVHDTIGNRIGGMTRDEIVDAVHADKQKYRDEWMSTGRLRGESWVDFLDSKRYRP